MRNWKYTSIVDLSKSEFILPTMKWKTQIWLYVKRITIHKQLNWLDLDGEN